MIWTDFLLAAALAAAVVLCLTIPLAHLGTRLRWFTPIDNDSLPSLVHPAPYTAGITVAIGMLTAAVVLPALQWPLLLALGALFVLGIGFADDHTKRMPAWSRPIAALAAAVLCTIGIFLQPEAASITAATIAASSTDATSAAAENPSAWLSIASAAIAIALLTFTTIIFQTVDRADGLADGLALIASIALGMSAYFAVVDGASGDSLTHIAAVLLSFIGALLALAFFTWRRPGRRHAAVLPGAGGVMMIGLIVGWLAWHAMAHFGAHGIGPGVLMWLIAIPLCDVAFYGVRQISTNRDRRRLIPFRALGLLQSNQVSRSRASSVLLLVAAVMAAIGLSGWRLGVPDILMAGAWMILFAIYSFSAMKFYHHRRERVPEGWKTEPASDTPITPARKTSL